MRISNPDQAVLDHVAARREAIIDRAVAWSNLNSCLLYTSDAADE